MMSWVVTFLIIALVAGLLGFGGIAGASIEFAKIVFFVALILFLISAVVGLARRSSGPWMRGSSPYVVTNGGAMASFGRHAAPAEPVGPCDSSHAP